MTVLGIDTSMSAVSTCVMLGDGSFVSTPSVPPERLSQPPSHSSELLPALAALLERSGSEWSEIEAIAVGIGPGTFTGLRIGVATARGLAQALDLRLRAVSSLEALALGLAGQTEPGGPLLALIDARRGEVFAALYERGPDDAKRLGSPVWGPLALAPAKLIELVGKASRPPIAAGDWALESSAELEAAGVEVPPPESGLHSVDARLVCRIGLETEPLAVDRVEPLYVRLPDAEISRRAANGEV